LTEKTSEYMAAPDPTKDASLPKEKPVSDKALHLSSVSVADTEKGADENSKV